MGTIGTPVERNAAYARNAAAARERDRILEEHTRQVAAGGGEEAMRRHQERGKLPARERIRQLVDPGTPLVEIGAFAADAMYQEFGGAPSAGLVVAIGSVEGRHAVIVANDATVKAGAWFPMTCKKHLRAQEIALENRLPIIYLVDSAGIFLPLQSEIFSDREHFGRVFRNNAIMSARGLTQIAAVMGPCVAGGAYLPVMSDETIMVEGTGSLFLAGPHLVRAAIGEEIDTEHLGGAQVHAEVSGVIDYRAADDGEALRIIRQIVARLGGVPAGPFDRIAPSPPRYDPGEIDGILPEDRSKPYDMLEILARLVDGGAFDEYKQAYGRTLLTGYARIDGWAVGIVANQRAVVRNGKGEMQVGGVIYSDSADKAARFIMNCNQKRIPLVFLQDVTGFMVGSRAEQGGIIKDGAKLVNVVANSVVPKFTVIVGNSYGAGNYALCGKAFDPRLIVAWPSASIGVMGGRQASETLLAIRMQQLHRGDKPPGHAEQQALREDIRKRYEKETDPYFAAARLWVDAIIRPGDTRAVLSRGLAIASCNGEIPVFASGVLQT